jgi:hypothetical protein
MKNEPVKKKIKILFALLMLYSVFLASAVPAIAAGQNAHSWAYYRSDSEHSAFSPVQDQKPIIFCGLQR